MIVPGVSFCRIMIEVNGMHDRSFVVSIG